jgi:hypothetical protein
MRFNNPVNNFWYLRAPESYRGYGTRAEWDESVYSEKIICPIKDSHIRGGRRISDLVVNLKSNRIGDFVWTWYNECLIQDHVLKLFRENNFTGFDVKPVTVKVKSGIILTVMNLCELVVIGWGGISPPQSGIKLLEYCSGCGLLLYSIFSDSSKLIDISQWDGSDFFMVWPLPKFIFITERVANFIRKEKITGCQIVRADEIPLLRKVPSLGPGRLSFWMPEERAYKLGKPLGIY